MTAHGTLAEALVAVQRAIPVVRKTKTARIPGKDGGAGYSYKYADLSLIAPRAHELLTQHGLAWVSAPTIADGVFCLEYRLIHGATGQEIVGRYPLPDPTRVTAQQAGSAITYARRYALCCVVGIVPDEDVDGAAVPPTSGRQGRNAERQRTDPDEAARLAAEPPASPQDYVTRMQATKSEAVVTTLMRDAGLAGMLDEAVTIPTGPDTTEQAPLAQVFERRLTRLKAARQ